MLVNCFFALVSALQGVQLSQLHQQSCWATAWLVHCKGVQLSQLHQQSCWAAAWLVHCKGVQLSQLHQQNCWATAWLVHCKGVQLSQLHQQSCGAFNRLVHLRQVHPLKAPPESTICYFTSTFFTLPLAVRTMLMPRCRFCMRTPPRV